MLSYSATKRMTIFKTDPGRAVSVGRGEMDVRNRRVISTHAWRGRRSRRSEIPSSGQVETTRSGVVCLAAAVLILAAAFYFDFSAAGLVAAVDLGVQASKALPSSWWRSL